jgi:hypothetical protein
MDDYRKKLALAIRSGYFLKNLEIDPKDASDLADYLLSFFGYEEEIIDNMLMRYDRDVFYQMEDKGILKTSQTIEKITGGKYAGKEWTLNGWILNMDSIYELIAHAYEKTKNVKAPEAVYKELFDSVSVEDLKTAETNPFPNSKFVFNEGWYSSMERELEEHMESEREKRAQNGNFYDYLSIFTTMLSPDIKPLAYLAMDAGTEYTVSGILKAMANKFGCSLEELENHVNIGSIMESLASVGVVHERKIELHRKETRVYTKSQHLRAFDAVASHAVRACKEKLEPAGLMLSDIFSISVAQRMSRAHSQNLFGLMKLLAENGNKDFTLYEIREIMDSDSVRHDVRLFKSRRLLDYESFSSNGGSEGKLNYRVLRTTSLEELHKKGFVQRPEKSWRLGKAIEFINENLDKDIDRFDVSKASGSDVDFSSKCLVMLSKAGVLERKAEWNKKRSSAKANENTVNVWNGLLSWLYNVAKEAGLRDGNGGGPLDRLEAAVLSYDEYLNGLRDYAKDGRLIEDCSAHFRYLSENRHKIGKNSKLAETILDVAKEGSRLYEIAQKLGEDTAVTYAGAQWHVKELLRKGLLEKEGNVYTTKSPKRADKRQ